MKRIAWTRMGWGKDDAFAFGIALGLGHFRGLDRSPAAKELRLRLGFGNRSLTLTLWREKQ